MSAISAIREKESVIVARHYVRPLIGVIVEPLISQMNRPLIPQLIRQLILFIELGIFVICEGSHIKLTISCKPW